MRKAVLCLALLALLCGQAGADVTGFEPPVYTAGTSISGVDGWTLTSTAPDQAAIQTTYVHSGEQALGLQQPAAGGTGSIALIKDFTAVNTGLLKVEYWAMPGDATDSTGVWIAVEDSRSSTKRAALFGFRSGVIAYNNGPWVNSTTAYTVGQWYKLTGIIDYNTRTWDFYLNDAPFASDLSFYHAAHTGMTNVRFYKGTSNLGMAVDDLTVAAVPEPSSLLALLCGGVGLAGLARRKS